MSSKRKAREAQLEEKTKRLKEASDTIASALISEFKCAISHELPVDPVTAEDGHVYERAAIEDWIAKAEAGERPLRSPKLNTPMGPRLLPATQTRNVIEHTVRSGIVSGPEAAAWSEKLAEEKEEEARRKAEAKYVAGVRAKAEGGDGDAMLHLGRLVSNGMKGLPEDRKQGAGWFRRGHDLNHTACTMELGLSYELGMGVERSDAMAMYLYTVAAKNGSEYACYTLGYSFAHKYCGVVKDEQEAVRWFTAMKTAPIRDSGDTNRAHAAGWLERWAK